MILRQSAEHYSRHFAVDGEADAKIHTHTLYGRGLALRQQLALLTSSLVVLAVLVAGGVAFWAARSAQLDILDSELSARAYLLLEDTKRLTTDDPNEMRDLVWDFKQHNPFIRAAVSPAESEAFFGDPVPVGGEYVTLSSGDYLSTRLLDNERVIVRQSPDGPGVALAQVVDPYGRIAGSFGAALLMITGLGGLLTWAVGSLVVAAGLRPLQRLKKAVDEVTRTEELRLLPVGGNDEMAQVSDSFNKMMETLQDSRTRQAQLVADAGHELKTPLTSMRTNIELLMMLYSMGQENQISPEDRADLERDVLAQMEEMSSLIADLVDLAREDAPGAVTEEFRLDEVLYEALERARRRRTDVTFKFRAEPWLMNGDRAAMSRAIINIFDNAVKWSPENGVVRISLRTATTKAVMIVDDSGPGIPESEREKVFERFYRATETRSTPGSGLGLAITKQALQRHKCDVFVESSDDEGARFRVVFPGSVPQPDDAV